jgi:alpha-aminoadipate carrier protein LysW
MKETFPTKKRGSKMIKQTAQLKPPEVKVINKTKCPDCDTELNIPADIEKGEILSCPGCGLELEVKQIKGGCVDLQELTIEGEDWGE